MQSMRKTLLAAAALVALTGAAHAEVDQTRADVPACVDPLKLDEAQALIRAGLQPDRETCLVLRAGTEVVKVQRIWGYQQIAIKRGDQTLMLFMDENDVNGAITAARRARDEAIRSERAKMRKGEISEGPQAIRMAEQALKNCKTASCEASLQRELRLWRGEDE